MFFMRIKSFLMTNTAVVMFFINALGKTIKKAILFIYFWRLRLCLFAKTRKGFAVAWLKRQILKMSKTFRDLRTKGLQYGKATSWELHGTPLFKRKQLHRQATTCQKRYLFCIYVNKLNVKTKIILISSNTERTTFFKYILACISRQHFIHI